MDDDLRNALARIGALEQVLSGFLGGSIDPVVFATAVDHMKAQTDTSPNLDADLKGRVKHQLDEWKAAVAAGAANHAKQP